MLIRPTPITPKLLINLKADFYLSCRGCRLLRTADPHALVAAGRGDQPIAEMKFRCTTCAALGRPTTVEPMASWRLEQVEHDYEFVSGALRIRSWR